MKDTVLHRKIKTALLRTYCFAGFSRLSLPWYSSDEEIDFILSALEMVAEHGWKLLPQYRYRNRVMDYLPFFDNFSHMKYSYLFIQRLNNETGEWKHHSNLEYRERKWLGNISYGAEGAFSFSDKYFALFVVICKLVFIFLLI